MRVASDPRVGLASAELRLVYPQLIRAPLPGPDHVGAVVVRAQLLGGDPRAVAQRVVDEALQLGLLVPEGDALVSVHRTRPRAARPADPDARRAQEREADARRKYVGRAMERGLTREQALADYAYRGGGVSEDSPRVSTPDGPGVSTSDTPLDTPPSEEKKEEEEAPSSSSSSSGKTDGNGSSTVKSATPGGGGVSGVVSTPSRGRTPPPPPHDPYPLPMDRVAGILTGTSNGRIGDGSALVRRWFEYRLVEMKVGEPLLRRMALLAKGGNLPGQKRRLEEKKLRATDLYVLASPDGEPDVLVSWLNEARHSLLEETSAAEKAAREKAQRDRDAKPAKPYQPGLGLPLNAAEASSNVVAPTGPVNPRLAELTSRAIDRAPVVRATQPEELPAAAGGDVPPKPG